MEIREFLHERLKEDEVIARQASLSSHGPHLDGDVSRWEVEPFESSEEGAVPAALWVADGEGMGVGQINPKGKKAEHVARWDPARVLAEVASKRAILGRHLPEKAGYFDPQAKTGLTFTVCEVDGNGGTDEDAWPCDELKYLAAPYAGHAQFDPAWRVEA